MKILGIDTSSKACSICIMDENEIIAEYTINNKKTHSQKLMPMIENAFKISELSIDDIDIIGVCIGPGSFTGLRIGIATSKAISHVKKIPIIEVNALESLAFNVSMTKSIICPIIDAQRNDVYTSLYEHKNKELVLLEDIMVKNIDELLNEVSSQYENVIMLGDASIIYEDKINTYNNINIANCLDKTARASSICEISKIKYSKKEYRDYLQINPLYIRKSQAEVDYEERLKRLR